MAFSSVDIDGSKLACRTKKSVCGFGATNGSQLNRFGLLSASFCLVDYFAAAQQGAISAQQAAFSSQHEGLAVAQPQAVQPQSSQVQAPPEQQSQPAAHWPQGQDLVAD
jgi:hypothetical protein